MARRKKSVTTAAGTVTREKKRLRTGGLWTDRDYDLLAEAASVLKKSNTSFVRDSMLPIAAKVLRDHGYSVEPIPSGVGILSQFEFRRP